MAYGSRPTMRKRILGSRLRSLRELKGLTYDEVANLIGVSRPKILRQEQGITAVPKADLRALLDLYGVQDREALDRLEYLRQQGWNKGHWHSYGPDVPYHLRDLADAESISTGMRLWEIGVVPGIFQTPEYTGATVQAATTILPAGMESPDELVRIREERKLILDAKEPPVIFAVIGEAALRTTNGGPKVLREQIDHLIELGRLPHISLQILPFSAGENPGAAGSFLLLRFEDLLGDQAVYIESARVLMDDPEMLADKSRQMDLLIAQAMSPQRSRALMKEIRATL